ncbi:MAG: DUF805 domain-containing protein [Bacteroidales bacterium]|jgi:uncharacterized membrane protein YhaH (DUF805 family)|nr:DUF805 domain-containing protein [Bacteroidales bacterium]
MKWYLNVLRHYADFSGRARPKEFWMFVLFNIIFGLAFALIDVAVNELTDRRTVGFVCRTMYQAVVFLPLLAVMVRRLHDSGRSGWWLLPGLFLALRFTCVPSVLLARSRDNTWMVILGFVYIASVIWMAVLMLQNSDQGDNRYGSDPKTVQPPYGEAARLRSAAVTLIVAVAVLMFIRTRMIIRDGVSVDVALNAVQVLRWLLLLAIGIMLLPRMSDRPAFVHRARRRVVFPMIAIAVILLSLHVTMLIWWHNIPTAVYSVHGLAVLLFALSLLSQVVGQWRRTACTALAAASCLVIVLVIYLSYGDYGINADASRLYTKMPYPVACILLSGVFRTEQKDSPDVVK